MVSIQDDGHETPAPPTMDGGAPENDVPPMEDAAPAGAARPSEFMPGSLVTTNISLATSKR